MAHIMLSWVYVLQVSQSVFTSS